MRIGVTQRRPKSGWVQVRRVAWGLGRTLVFALLLIVVAASVLAPILHVQLLPVLTGSMRPAYGPGDLLVAVPSDVANLRPGQIAIFTPPGESVPYAHRIATVTGTGDHPVLTTKGDANPAPDQWHARLESSQLPVVAGVVPIVGYAFLWAQNPVVRAVLSGFFGLSITGVGVLRILRAPSSEGGKTPSEIQQAQPEPAL